VLNRSTPRSWGATDGERACPPPGEGHGHLARIEQDRGDLPRALKFHREAARLWGDLGDSAEEAKARQQIRRIEKQQTKKRPKKKR